MVSPTAAGKTIWILATAAHARFVRSAVHPPFPTNPGSNEPGNNKSRNNNHRRHPTLIATVQQHNQIRSGTDVLFTTSQGTFGATNASSITLTTNAGGKAVALLRSAQSGNANVTATAGQQQHNVSITFTALPDYAVSIPITPTQQTKGTLSHSNLQKVILTAAVQPGTSFRDNAATQRVAHSLRMAAVDNATIPAKPSNSLGRFFTIEVLDRQGNILKSVETIHPPLAITCDVGNAPDLEQLAVHEIALRFQQADEKWDDDGIVLQSSDERERRLTFTVDHLTTFALVQENPVIPFYLPLIRR
jgi:hypothetical protein